jgi:hypothetical protein
MRGRRTSGPELVQRLVGEAQAKQRLEVILRTLSGQLGIKQASAQLGLTPQRLHELRQEALAAALAALAPRPLGRPRQRATAEQEQIDDLQHQIEQLQQELHSSQLREQLAVLLPGRAEPGEKKRGSAAAHR